MNTITEPRHRIPSSEVTGSQGSNDSPQKPGLGQLWLAILALVGIVALAAAVALGAFDSSSQSDGTITVVDPRADADSHRTAPVNQAMDADTQRELNQRASEAVASASALDARADADSHRTAPVVPVDADATRELNQQASQSDGQPDPRQDSDHHREASN
jgi:hypothetical protein